MPRSFNASSTGYVECDCVLLCTFMQVPGVGEMRHGTEGWKCLETSMRTMVAILDGAGMTVILFLCVYVVCMCVYMFVCVCVCVCLRYKRWTPEAGKLVSWSTASEHPSVRAKKVLFVFQAVE